MAADQLKEHSPPAPSNATSVPLGLWPTGVPSRRGHCGGQSFEGFLQIEARERLRQRAKDWAFGTWSSAATGTVLAMGQRAEHARGPGRGGAAGVIGSRRSG